MTTTMNINTMPATFTFRSKFEKLLNDENRPIITAAFQKFCGFSHGKALSILWQLTYKPNEVPFYFTELGLAPEQISDEVLPVFVSELRTQYQKLNPNFCKVTVPEELREAYEAFTNATSIIVSKHVYERSTSQMYRAKEIEINLSKMVDEKTNQETREYAIKFFSFGCLEAQYLHTYRKPLHDLLEKMYELRLLSVSQPFTIKPFEGLDSLVKDAGMDLPFDFGESSAKEVPVTIQEEQPAQTNSGFKRLTSEEVLAHKDVFASFLDGNDLNMLLGIGQLGFDLNTVVAKKTAIANLLEAKRIKENADAYLAEAIDFLNN